MKLSKKVLAAFSVAAALAMAVSFVSCANEEADDEEGAISGSNNNYTLVYDNTTGTDNYRCYKPTKNNHRGALCQITLKKEGTSFPGAAMGYIWDLYSTDASASAEEVARSVSSKPRNFCIVGFNYSNTSSGKVAYYVSRYTNVYDIQAKNFGEDGVEVNGKTEKAVETPYLDLNTTNTFTPTPDADGNIIVTVNVYEETSGTETTGGYVVDIYDGAVTKDTLSAATKKATTTIPADALGYDTAKKATQRQGAVYANVYKGYKASGAWKYNYTYSADEVVEE